MSSDEGAEDGTDGPSQFEFARPRRILRPVSRRRPNVQSSTSPVMGFPTELLSPNVPGQQFGGARPVDQATASQGPTTALTASFRAAAIGAGGSQPQDEPSSSGGAKDEKASEAEDNCPVFLPRAAAPDAALTAALTARRRAAYERDGGTLGPTDKETDIYDLQRQINAINKLRGPGNEVGDEERHAMEEKLLKLKRGQWYNEVLQQAREKGDDTVGLEHFRRLIAEMDQIPVSSLREILKLGPIDQLARLEADRAARDQTIDDLKRGSSHDKNKWEEEKNSLKKEIDQLEADAATKDRKITGLEEQLAIERGTIANMQSTGQGVGKAKKITLLTVEKEKLQIQLDTANNALNDALEKLKQKSLNIQWKEKQIELRDEEIAGLATSATGDSIPDAGKQLREKNQVIRDLQTQLEQKTLEVDKKAEVVFTREGTIRDLKRTIDTKIQEIRKKEQESIQKDHEIAGLTGRFEAVRDATQVTKADHGAQTPGEAVQQQTDERDPVEDGEAITSLKTKLGERDQIITALQKQLKNCEDHRRARQTRDDDKQHTNVQDSQTDVDAALAHGPKDGEIERLREELQKCQEHGRKLQEDFDRQFMSPVESQVEDAAQPAACPPTAKDKKIKELTDLVRWGQARIKEVKLQIASLEAEKTSLALRLQEAQDLLAARTHAQTLQDVALEADTTAFLERELEEYRKTIQAQTAENTSLAAKAKKLEQDLAASCPKSELDQCQKRVGDLQTDVDKLKTVGTNIVESFKKREMELNAKIAVLEEEKKQLTVQLEAIQKKAAGVDARVEQLRDQLVKTANEREEFSSSIDDLRGQLQKSKAEQDARHRQISDLEKQGVEINAKLEQTQKDRDSTNAELALAKSELESIKSDLESTRSEKQALEVEKESLKATLETETLRLGEQLAKATLRAEQLESELEQCEAHRRELQDTEEERSSDDSHDVKDLQDLVTQLQGKLAEVEEAHKVCEADRKELQRQLAIVEGLEKSTGIEGLPPTDPATCLLQATIDDLRRQLNECKENHQSLQDKRARDSEPLVTEGETGDPDSASQRATTAQEQGSDDGEAALPPTQSTSHPSAHGKDDAAPSTQHAPPHPKPGAAPESVQSERSVPEHGTKKDADNDSGNQTIPTRRNAGRRIGGWLWRLVVLAVLAIAALVRSGWCWGQVMRTRHGYYYHGGFDGHQLDLSFAWWQFCCVSGLIGFVAVALVAQAWRAPVGFVAALAAALIDEVVARRRAARRG